MMNSNIQNPSYKLEENEKPLSLSVRIFLTMFIFTLICLLIIFFYFIKEYGENNAQQILDLIRILLSWPVVGTTIALLFIYKFSGSIRNFLETHQLSKAGPIGVQQKIGKDITLPGGNGSKENEKKSLAKKVAKLKRELEAKDKDKAKLEDFVQDQQKINEIYEFNYLALFFVDTTKRVLKWFFDQKDKTIITNESFNTDWQTIIIDPNQRATIFAVLQHYGMIQGIPGGAFSITDKGDKFLRFIGFIQ